jgi:hypothetical protein
MTAPRPATLEREKDKLFLTDAELIRKLGVPARPAREALEMLDRDPSSRFPRKQKLRGSRRYWPAVKEWLDKHNGLLSK